MQKNARSLSEVGVEKTVSLRRRRDGVADVMEDELKPVGGVGG